jgi:hypothetical protein
MKTLIATLLGSAALLAAPLAAQAQQAQQAAQWVAVPAGFTAVLLPDGAAPISVPLMPDPAAMIQQINAMLAQAEQNAAALQTQFVAAQNTAPAAGVMITTVSDGSHSCTERITYSGTGAQPQIQLTSTANGCALAGFGRATPALLPNAAPQSPAPPKLIQAQAKSGEMVLADRD